MKVWSLRRQYYSLAQQSWFQASASGAGRSAGDVGDGGSSAGEVGEGTCHKATRTVRSNALFFSVALLSALLPLDRLFVYGLFRVGLRLARGRRGGRVLAIDLKARSRWTKQVNKGARLAFRRACRFWSNMFSSSTEKVNSGVSNKAS